MIHVNRARQSGCKQPFDNRRGGRRWYTEGYAANLGEQQMRRDRTCRKRRPPGTTGTARTLVPHTKLSRLSNAHTPLAPPAATHLATLTRSIAPHVQPLRQTIRVPQALTRARHLRQAQTRTRAPMPRNAPKRLPPTVSATRNPLPRRSRATFPRSTACARLPCSASSRITWAWRGRPAACLASRCSSSCPATLLPAFC